MKQTYGYILLVCLIAVFSTGCASSKKSGKTSLPNKAYHDITARNNSYFNGNDRFKRAVRGIVAAHKDDYKEVLPLYPERDAEAAKSFTAEFDEIIKKSSFVVKVHEPARWADNSYMLIGKSYYYKGDLNNALETFQYVTTEYKTDTDGDAKKKKVSSSKSKKKKKKALKKKKKKNAKMKKKKKKGKSTSSKKTTSSKKGKQPEKTAEEEETESAFKDFFHHLPSRPDAMIWVADCYATQKKYRDAETVHSVIEGDKEFPMHRLKDELLKSKANNLLSQQRYYDAVPLLTEYRSLFKSKRKTSRITYILGQIYEKGKNYKQAVEEYKLVLKSNPSFEMGFQAKMSIARISAKDISIPYNETYKLLTRLLRDRKYDDYFDQIYYARAELQFNNGKKKEAIADYLKSTEVSKENVEQKGLSFLRLADIAYNEERYQDAKQFYDSTLAFIPTTYAGIDDVKIRIEVLSKLVKELNIISLEDSLQKVALLSEKEIEKYIADIVEAEKKKAAEEEAKGEESNGTNAEELLSEIKSTSQSKGQPNPQGTQLGSGSNWYFYNSSLKSAGYNEFQKKWGPRKFEDDWRRKNKGSAENDDTEEEDVEEEEEIELVSTGDKWLDRSNEIKSKLPLTPEKRDKSDKKIIDALYGAGYIYKTDLRNIDKAISTFEELMRRFPSNQYEAEVWYNLSILYGQKGDEALAVMYREKILSSYPNGKFAKVIKDPDYFNKLNQKDKTIEKYYEETFALFTGNRNYEVLRRIREADTIFKVNELKPKFALLEAFAIGKTDSLRSYIAALQKVVTLYPEDEVRKKAEEILEYLKKNENQVFEITVNSELYNFDLSSIHFLMFSYPADSLTTLRLGENILKYNDEFKQGEKYNLEEYILKDKGSHQLLLVKAFKNLKLSLEYLEGIQLQSDIIYAGVDKSKIKAQIVSDINFNKIFKNNEILSYYDFYNLKYPTSTQ